MVFFYLQTYVQAVMGVDEDRHYPRAQIKLIHKLTEETQPIALSHIRQTTNTFV